MLLGRGHDHVAYLLDGSIVVRFASGEHAARDVAREARLLELVAGIAHIPVPRPVFVQPDLGGLVYELLPGVSLIEAQISDPVPIARDLGRLLAALHAVEHERVRDLVDHDDEPLDSWLGEAVSHYESLGSAIPAEARPAIDAFLATPPPPRGTQLVFSHNDLGIEHVLVDPSTLAVTGVIDWSDAALCDPAYDFGLVFRDLGRDALQAAFAAYGEARDLEERAVFYARCALLEDLAYGVETGRTPYVGKSLAGLRWVF